MDARQATAVTSGHVAGEPKIASTSLPTNLLVLLLASLPAVYIKSENIKDFFCWI